MMDTDIKAWSNKYNSCIKCHETSKRHEAFGYCRKCYNIIHADKIRYADKKFRESNREKLREISRNRGYRSYKNRIKIRNEVNNKKEACEICEKVCKTVFDHDHNTGKFRG